MKIKELRGILSSDLVISVDELFKIAKALHTINKECKVKRDKIWRYLEGDVSYMNGYVVTRNYLRLCEEKYKLYELKDRILNLLVCNYQLYYFNHILKEGDFGEYLIADYIEIGDYSFHYNLRWNPLYDKEVERMRKIEGIVPSESDKPVFKNVNYAKNILHLWLKRLANNER